MKYIIFRRRGKKHDLEKIAQYAEMAWTISGGKWETLTIIFHDIPV